MMHMVDHCPKTVVAAMNGQVGRLRALPQAMPHPFRDLHQLCLQLDHPEPEFVPVCSLCRPWAAAWSLPWRATTELERRRWQWLSQRPDSWTAHCYAWRFAWNSRNRVGRVSPKMSFLPVSSFFGCSIPARLVAGQPGYPARSPRNAAGPSCRLLAGRHAHDPPGATHAGSSGTTWCVSPSLSDGEVQCRTHHVTLQGSSSVPTELSLQLVSVRTCQVVRRTRTA